MNAETNTLTELSESLADAVESASQSIVMVNARRRLPATGIVWAGDNVIVTANHVVERDDDITIGFPDGSSVEATLRGRDPRSDLAVLQAASGELSPATLAASEARVGNLILALGKPSSESPVATLGVVSAVGGFQPGWTGGRSGPGGPGRGPGRRGRHGHHRGRGARGRRAGAIESLIRTDITMYPGFSGGPLVNAAGEVFGLNSSALSRGMATTIPHAHISGSVQTLLEHGRIARGYLGLAMQPVQLPEGVKDELAAGQEIGVMVVGVEPDSPASTAGLLLGDTLLSLGGEAATDVRSLHELLGPESVGSTLTVRYIRAGQLQETDITIGER